MNGRTISVPEAAERSKVPERTFRRRMHVLNEMADGRLLVPTGGRFGKRVGKWLVVVAVLDEVAPARSKSRAATMGELDEVQADVVDAHQRIDMLDARTNGQSARLRKHDRAIKKNRAAIEALRRAEKALHDAGLALAGD